MRAFDRSKYNAALLAVLACKQKLGENPERVFMSKEGHFMVGDVQDPSAPTNEEILNAINLSLSLRNANWDVFQLELQLERPGLALLASVANKIGQPKLTTWLPLTVRIPGVLGYVEDTLAVSRIIGPDPRQLTESEVEAISEYVGNSYKKINAFLRGEKKYILDDSAYIFYEISVGEVLPLLMLSLSIISGLNKNHLPLDTPESALRLCNLTGDAIDSFLSSADTQIIRLLSDVPLGVRAELTSLSGKVVSAPGVQSWTYFEGGAPEIQANKLFRLKMSSGGQRPFVDYFGSGWEGEIAYGPLNYRVLSVSFSDHVHARTNERKPIIEVVVEKVQYHETNHYWFELALSVAYQNHLRHPYKGVYHSHQGVYRPNHALAHHVRVAMYIDGVVDYFKAHATDALKIYCTKLSEADREKLKVFMAFSRTGRESENDFKTDPVAYKKELAASAEYFKSFVLLHNIMTENEIDLWCRVLLDMGNPEFDENIESASRNDLKEYDNQLTGEQKQKARCIHHIVNFAHKLDLPRCFNESMYRYAVLPYVPGSVLVPSSDLAKIQMLKMERIASDMLLATGESVFGVGETQASKTIFVDCNMSVLHCLDVCKHAVLADDIVSSIKPFFAKLNKLLRYPALFSLHKRLLSLGVYDFPSDLFELEAFLQHKVFGENPIVSEAVRPQLFQDVGLLLLLDRVRMLDIDKKKIIANYFFSSESNVRRGYEKLTSIKQFNFLLSFRFLKEEHRALLLALYAENPSHLVVSRDDLLSVIQYPHLNVKFNEVIEKKIYLVDSDKALYAVLSFFGITVAQGDHVLSLLVDRLPELINNLNFLPALLDCRGVSEAGRALMIKAVEKDLYNWMCASADSMLNVLHCTYFKDYHLRILKLIIEGLDRYPGLHHPAQMLEVLHIESLKSHHKEIVAAYASRLSNVIYTARDTLFLKDFILTEEDRKFILERIHGSVLLMAGKSFVDAKMLLNNPALKKYHPVIMESLARHLHDERQVNLPDLIALFKNVFFDGYNQEVVELAFKRIERSYQAVSIQDILYFLSHKVFVKYRERIIALIEVKLDGYLPTIKELIDLLHYKELKSCHVELIASVKKRTNAWLQCSIADCVALLNAPYFPESEKACMIEMVSTTNLLESLSGAIGVLGCQCISSVQQDEIVSEFVSDGVGDWCWTGGFHRLPDLLNLQNLSEKNRAIIFYSAMEHVLNRKEEYDVKFFNKLLECQYLTQAQRDLIRKPPEKYLEVLNTLKKELVSPVKVDNVMLNDRDIVSIFLIEHGDIGPWRGRTPDNTTLVEIAACANIGSPSGFFSSDAVSTRVVLQRCCGDVFKKSLVCVEVLRKSMETYIQEKGIDVSKKLAN